MSQRGVGGQIRSQRTSILSREHYIMSRLPYIPLPAALAAMVTTLCAPAAAAQQILEVDLSAGRTIIDDQWRSMGSIVLAVDHDRGILYVNDAEEPEGIMAFSLATGGADPGAAGAGRRWPARVLPASFRDDDGPRRKTLRFRYAEGRRVRFHRSARQFLKRGDCGFRPSSPRTFPSVPSSPGCRPGWFFRSGPVPPGTSGCTRRLTAGATSC